MTTRTRTRVGIERMGWDGEGGMRGAGGRLTGDEAEGISFVKLVSIVLLPVLWSGPFFFIFIAQH
jgi:hypothetical protein